ncbi:MAG: InlB B-repeat-containing protein [Treponema sp.]|jgi:uncharacterized repeat protein (TIGR02543 family)|nr:InlB B-repeat-containing protein [Treponema sp.]
MKWYISILAIIVFLSGCELNTPETPEITYYTVTYFGNGNDSGEIPVDSNTYPDGSSAIILDKGTLTKTGHVFLHWDTNPRGNGVTYNPNESIVINSDRSLYAIWGAGCTVTFNSDGGSKIASITGLAPGVEITKPDDPIMEGYSFDSWYKDAQFNEAWNFDNDTVTVSITLYAKWINIAPGEVEITNCLFNAANNSVDIYYTTPSDIDLDYLIVYVDGAIYYDSIPKTYIAVYIYNILNGAVVTIKTVDTAGLVSNGISYTIDIPDFTIVTDIIKAIPNSTVIRKYPDRIEPPTLSFSLSAWVNNEYVTIDALPAGWTLSYTTSTQSTDIPYTGPITIERSWEWIEFSLYRHKDNIFFGGQKIPILSNSTPATAYELIPSASVIKRYNTGMIDPPTISCAQQAKVGNSPPTTSYITLTYITSSGSETLYTGPITVGDWDWIEFRLYDGATLVDWEDIPVLTDRPQ